MGDSLLSATYAESRFATDEWAAAFIEDPTGHGGRLVPVHIAEFKPKGLLRPIVSVDLVGLDQAAGPGRPDRRGGPGAGPSQQRARVPAPERASFVVNTSASKRRPPDE